MTFIQVALGLDQPAPLGARALCCAECAHVLWRGARVVVCSGIVFHYAYYISYVIYCVLFTVL